MTAWSGPGLRPRRRALPLGGELLCRSGESRRQPDAIKALVYESRELSIAEFWRILQADYEGHEDLRLRILNKLPSYGTDRDEVDALAVEFAEFLQQTTEANIIGGHRYVPGFFCWIMHGEFGSHTCATPDGRKAGFALADGAGAPKDGKRPARRPPFSPRPSGATGRPSAGWCTM